MSEEKHEEVELAQELRELGQQLKQVIRVAREHPQTKEFERQVAQAVNDLSAQIDRALKSAADRERIKHATESAAQQMKQTAESLRVSAKEDVEHGLARGVHALNEQIRRAITQAEKREPTSAAQEPAAQEPAAQEPAAEEPPNPSEPPTV